MALRKKLQIGWSETPWKSRSLWRVRARHVIWLVVQGSSLARTKMDVTVLSGDTFLIVFKAS